MRPSFRVYVDFDGTISLADSTDQLLERFAEPEWEEVETAWLAGQIGSAECMRRQIDLLRVRPEALHAFIGGIGIDPAFTDFVRFCRSRGLPVAVVSDGLDLVIHGALRAAGLSLPVFANRLTWIEADRWSLNFPYARTDCAAEAGHCKCAQIAPHAPDGSSAILIGDGRSDYCGAQAADFVFAKASLLAHCRTRGVDHEPFVGFADLTARFERFVDRRSWPSLEDVLPPSPLVLRPA